MHLYGVLGDSISEGVYRGGLRGLSKSLDNWSDFEMRKGRRITFS